jgi:1-acyl-sn-glycerol-3-phosphate acyltransferase
LSEKISSEIYNKVSPVKSLLFQIFICVWGIIIPIIYFLVFLTKNRKMADRGAKNWARFSLFMLEKICGIRYEVRGKENLPKESGFVVACKHQSMWETIVFHIVFDQPVYSWKKELLKIPFYGWFLRIMSGITIDRKGGAKALKSLLNQAKQYVENKQNIILFPQGTRTPIGSGTKDYPYQSGVAAIYNHLKVPVVPAALNAGVFWDKGGIKKSGTIILEFLPAIEAGLKKQEFMAKLEKQIESKSNDLS